MFRARRGNGSRPARLPFISQPGAPVNRNFNSDFGISQNLRNPREISVILIFDFSFCVYRNCAHRSKTPVLSVGAGVLDRPAAHCRLNAFARARRKNVGSPAREGQAPPLRTGGNICTSWDACAATQALRADEGIGPYDAGLPFRSVGVDPQIDPSTLSSS